MMMPMHFFFSDKVMLLFDFWNVQSPAGMVLSVLVVMLLAVLYESIKIGKAKLLQRTKLAISPSTSQGSLLDQANDTINDITVLYSNPTQRWLWLHAGQSLIHIIQVILGYLLMLCVMSYNSWIFLGILAGSAIGYFLAYPLLLEVLPPTSI
ncbi:probable low affinity copper uptake protein 2 [Rhinatrema bivittatum]|uniref:probable low affinity copper uptake protein 2 n=1 Tax=Rhinatrema bivittatum TaxID=194408 RepID=UPI0011264CD2|nr:probable low affinity copper uptake protein 2 [Rhinatrema bivittatum]